LEAERLRQQTHKQQMPLLQKLPMPQKVPSPQLLMPLKQVLIMGLQVGLILRLLPQVSQPLSIAPGLSTLWAGRACFLPQLQVFLLSIFLVKLACLTMVLGLTILLM